MKNPEMHKDILWQFKRIALNELSKLSFVPALKVWQRFWLLYIFCVTVFLSV